MCAAGQSMNRWSLEEMVKRDPDNSLILLQQIIRKTREVRGATSQGRHAAHRAPLTYPQLSVCLQVLEECQYELVAPLAIMFSSTLLQVHTLLLILVRLLHSTVAGYSRQTTLIFYFSNVTKSSPATCCS